MYIGIDIGGTTGRVAAFESLTEPKQSRRQDFAMERNYAVDSQAMLEAIRKVSDGKPLTAIGVGIAGVVDPTGSTITGSGNLTDWIKQPIRHDLQNVFECSVIIANDAYAAALSEATYGQIHKQDFWFVVWGTGVGGSCVVHHHGGLTVHPSELGHQVIDWSKSAPVCGCGSRGCLEAFVGGGAIAQRYGKPAEELTDAEWDEVCVILVRGLHNLVSIQPVSRLVLGGGVAIKQSHRLPKIQKLLEESLVVVPAPSLALVTHREDAGITGALALLRHDQAA